VLVRLADDDRSRGRTARFGERPENAFVEACHASISCSAWFTRSDAETSPAFTAAVIRSTGVPLRLLRSGHHSAS
jgi:hypothetical protein